MDADAGDTFAASLDFTRMETGADLHAEGPQAIAEGERATDGTRRAVEAREQPVTREVSDRSTEALDLRPCEFVMPLEQFTPPRVTQLDGSSGGVDDVR